MVAKTLQRIRKEEKGFTLIELLAVIVILGVIAAIAVPLISNIISDSKTKSDFATARQIYDASRLYVTTEKEGDFKGLTIKFTDSTKNDGLIDKGYLDSTNILPSSKNPIVNGEVVYTTDGDLLYVHIVTNPAEELSYYKGSEVLKGNGTPLKDPPTTP